MTGTLLSRTSQIMLLGLIGLLMPVTAAADISVLAYHHVSAETPPSTSTTPELFRDQLDMIESLDMTPVTLSGETTKAALKGHSDDKLRVALTFDDAYESVYTTAWPILKKRGIPFTIFVMTDAIDEERYGYMNWDQLRELADHELVTIGNHTADHGSFLRRDGESKAERTKRIAKSLDKAQRRIQEELGIESELVAHPYGEFSEPSVSAIKERGWYGYAQHSGILGAHSSPYAIPRFPVANAYGGTDTLENKLKARSFPVAHQNLPSPVLGKENPPRLSLPLPDSWNAGRLSCFAAGEGRMEVKTAQSDGATVATVQANKPIKARRSRYNCTYPAGNGRFYWLSQPWFNRAAPEG